MASKKPTQPNPDPEEESILLRKWVGIKNTVRPERLGPDELEKAVDIDLDDVGQPHRRRGYRQFGGWTNRCHSLFTCSDGRTFVVAEQGGLWHLIWVKPDGVSTGANFALVSKDPISYAQVDHRIYYSSDTASGIIDVSADEPTYSAWGSGPDEFFSVVTNPTATLPAIRGKLRGKPPQARYIAYSNGRIYLARDNIIWFTELWDYNHVDKTANFWQFEADITMIAGTTNDLYVGTVEGLYFVAGTAKEPKRVRVMDSAVIPGSMVYVPSELGNPALMQKGPPGSGQDTDVEVAIVFLTTAGYCAGQDNGVVYNLTESKVIFPGAVSAAAMFRRQDGLNQYVAVTGSGGTPSSNTRLGDYVDAEIRRGGASWNTLSGGVKVGDSFTVYKNGVLSP